MTEETAEAVDENGDPESNRISEADRVSRANAAAAANETADEVLDLATGEVVDDPTAVEAETAASNF